MKKIILIIALATAAINLFSQEERMYIMKDGVVMNEYLVSDIDSIIFYNPIDPSTVDEGVIINGVKWATRNVAAPGHFADNPEDPGMFYQWNRKVAWAATGSVSGWSNTAAAGTTWEKANDPCPAGWRVPTIEKLETLLNTEKVTKEWTTQNGVNGYKFTDKTTNNSLFLPAAGYRYYSDGALSSAGSGGYYWSSTQTDSGYAYYWNFGSGYAAWGYDYRSYGFSVRAVAE
ncbi:hypothetical protein FACS189434_01180 [Bacteroidia bacterium]|nr:hypothetical protein FACS189434_01180 [Bacteroidia bacterium]